MLASALVFAGHPYPKIVDSYKLSVAITNELTALAFLYYILYRQGRSLSAIGFGFEPQDILRSIGLWVSTYVVYVGMYYLLYATYLLIDRTLVMPPMPFSIPVSALSLAFACLNPFFEELIVRAFFMTELLALTGRGWIAVIASAVFQSAYHLYQGGLIALMYLPVFALLSLYYLRKKRIGPIILVHLYVDLAALLVQHN
ncbi:MAG: Abortive infection protein [Acidobacteriales bacterium]|nr:Abortive infection protein [Terriglobales bacterium]